MKYQSTMGVSGNWVKKEELKNGTRAKIVSEVKSQPSNFQNKDGGSKDQDVGKVKFEGAKEAVNVSFNRATISGLIQAFGEESTSWMNKVLKVETEKMRVGGKAVVALYLIPEGYKKIDDENGYATIVKEGVDTPKTADEELDELGADEPNPDDIPF